MTGELITHFLFFFDLALRRFKSVDSDPRKIAKWENIENQNVRKIEKLCKKTEHRDRKFQLQGIFQKLYELYPTLEIMEKEIA